MLARDLGQPAANSYHPCFQMKLATWARGGGTADGWVHICSTLKELVGAKKLGANTVWLNAGAAAAADEESYLSANVVSDFADSVCAGWSGLEAAIEEVSEVIAEEEREALRATAASATWSAAPPTTLEGPPVRPPVCSCLFGWLLGRKPAEADATEDDGPQAVGLGLGV